MAKPNNLWKSGSGELGFLDPIIGSWKAEGPSPMGPMVSFRAFAPILGGKYVQMTARSEFSGGTHEMIAIIGRGPDGALGFWLFANDGKGSQGTLADVTDIHPEAFGFETQIPTGLARVAYWPADGEGFRWSFESKEENGWKRLAEHHYRPA